MSHEDVLHWLQQTRLVEVPSDLTLRSAQVSLRGLFGLWPAALVLVLAAAGVFWLYRRERGRLGLLRRLLLAGLRITLIALVLVLLIRPVLIAELHGERPRGVAVLIDNTQSMRQRDRRITPADRARAAIARGLLPADASFKDAELLAAATAGLRGDPTRAEMVRDVMARREWRLFDRLGERGPVQTLLFDRRLRSPIKKADDSLDDFQADGGQTALADALHELLVRSGSEPPTAVVVVSDGRDNASKYTLAEAAREYRDRGVPLHVWGVGASSGGVLQIRDVSVPNTVFVDDKPEVQDDPLHAVIHWRCRGFKERTVTLKVTLGDQVVRRQLAVKEGDDVQEKVSLVPEKGKEGPRLFRAEIELEGVAETRDSWQRMVQVKSSRVKVLYVENVPRREYKFLQPLLDRDRRVLARIYLAEADPRVAREQPASDRALMFLEHFPETFPDPEPRDPDRRPYDLVILGDVPPSALGEAGVRALVKFVKEGGGLVVISGPQHLPGDYAYSPLAEVFPVEFKPLAARPPIDLRTQPYKPVLTYEGERSAMLALADGDEDNRKLWQEDLWKECRGFYWFYPVTGLRAGATALLVHPDRKVEAHPGERPLPLVASHYFGKGEVLFFGVEEMWRWRDNTGDRLTARFWGQVITQLGLPHLLGESRRVQLALERSESVLGRPGSVRARLLSKDYEPLTRPTVRAMLVHLDRSDAGRFQPVELKRISGMPGEYRATLPNDTAGRFELRVEESEGLEPATLAYRVDLPPRHELEIAGMAEEALRGAAEVSKGRFYHEEDLPGLPDRIERRTLPFVQRQEVLLWNWLAFAVFVVLITMEWTLRKYSNLS
jgi:hypothetical protein